MATARIRLSARARRVEASGIRRVFDLARAIPDPVDLSIGQPDFSPPPALAAAAARAIRSGFNRYLPTAGLPALIERVRKMLKATRGFEPEAVMITSGVSGGLALAYLALLDAGDEFVTADPYFVSYKELAAVAGAVPRFADTYPDFRLTPRRMERALGRKTRFILFASPSNPTGAALGAAEIEAIADLARAERLLVISDEVYDAFVYDGPHRSIASVYPEGTLLLGGFSKTWGVPGWRVGYAAGPSPLIDAMARMQQYTFVCAPSPFQAALASLDLAAPPRAVAAFRKRRDFVCGALSGRYRLVRPGGAFYVFPEVPRRWRNGSAFAEVLVREGVLVVPGAVFSGRDTHFRLSYAAPDDTLKRGLAMLRRAAAGARATR